jgi:hypothetical protein
LAVGVVEQLTMVAVVDGNVYRVLARYFGISDDITSTAGKLRFAQLAQELIPHQQPASYNQAIMEFGATCCTPHSPACDDCVLRSGCKAKAGQNPPDGAMIDYYLEDNASTAVTLEILDANNNLVRKYSSEDKPYAVGDVNIPLYWIRPQEILSAAKGPHRFLWDLRYAPLDVPPSYPISAIYQQTAPEPTSPFVMPGNYIVKLTVGGKSFTQPLTVKMDPRVKLSTLELQTQFDLSLSTYSNRKTCLTTAAQVHSYREQIKSLKAQARGTIPAVLAKADDQLAQFESNQRIDNAPVST